MMKLMCVCAEAESILHLFFGCGSQKILGINIFSNRDQCKL
jgi:hypothetical protein